MNITFREQLEKDWMAQQKWLDFTNYLVHRLEDLGNTQWIDVKERLPEVETGHEGFTRYVLVAHRRYFEPVKGRYLHGLKQWRIEGSNSNINSDVYAWQPMPALPPAPEEGEKR